MSIVDDEVGVKLSTLFVVVITLLLKVFLLEPVRRLPIGSEIPNRDKAADEFHLTPLFQIKDR